MPREGKGNLRLVIPGITGNGKGKKIKQYGYIQDIILKDNWLNVSTQHSVLYVSICSTYIFILRKALPSQNRCFEPFFYIKKLIEFPVLLPGQNFQRKKDSGMGGVPPPHTGRNSKKIPPKTTFFAQKKLF